MARRTYCWWSLVLLFGGRNPKDPLGRFGSLGRQWGSWSLGSTSQGAIGGRFLFVAIKKRTRLGPLDDHIPPYEVLLRTVGGWSAPWIDRIGA